MAIFGHSRFVQVFLGKIVRKNLEQPFLAIPNLYQSFWEKLSEIIQNSHFWPFQICRSLFGKSYQEKLGMTIFFNIRILKSHPLNSKLMVPPPYPKNTGTNLKWPKIALLNLFKHVMVCNGL